MSLCELENLVEKMENENNVQKKIKYVYANSIEF